MNSAAGPSAWVCLLLRNYLKIFFLFSAWLGRGGCVCSGWLLPVSSQVFDIDVEFLCEVGGFIPLLCAVSVDVCTSRWLCVSGGFR